MTNFVPGFVQHGDLQSLLLDLKMASCYSCAPHFKYS